MHPIILPDHVYELRVPKAGRQGTISGYFDDAKRLQDAAATLDGKYPGLYFTLNPCNPALLARATNRMQSHARTTTSDKDILKRCWLLIDCDPVRPSDISSTDAQHEAALDRCHSIADWLRTQGWPAPLFADSGNGAHALYRIDLPNDDASRDMLKACLEVLALKFNDAVVVVDTGMFNAARITKLYGSMVMKGDSTENRPHRRSEIKCSNVTFDLVPLALLQALAAQRPPDPKPTYHGSTGPFDVHAFMTKHSLYVRREKPWQNGSTVYELEQCPFNAEHANGEASIIVAASGAIGFNCFHSSCQGYKWEHVREKYEPQRPKWNGAHTGKTDNVRHSTKPADTGGVETVAFSTVQSDNVQWLWKGRIPLGMLTGLVGDPDLGKTTIAMELAARASRGQLQGDIFGKPISVCLCSAEDSPRHVLKPRLAAAGADMVRVHLLQFREGGLIRGVQFPTDCDAIREQMQATGSRILIIDPLVAHLPSQLNCWRDQDVRVALAALNRVAEDLAATIIFLVHLNKNNGSGNPLYRISNSIGIPAAARSILWAAPDPVDDTAKLLLHIKCNVAAKAPAIRYRLESRLGDGVNTSGVVWGGEDEHVRAEDVMQPDRGSSEERTERGEAKEWLSEFLGTGNQRTEHIFNEGHKAGLSERTLRRAKSDLRLKARRIGGTDGYWVWEPAPVKDGHITTRGRLYSDSQKNTNNNNNIFKDLKMAKMANTESGDHLSSDTPPTPCFTCHASKFWRSIHGSTVCATCHPPARHDLVAEWLGYDR
jgi:hypothetical protein